MSDYYNKKIQIPTVTKSGIITGSIDRWKAHEKGILHKAFSVALFHNNQIILQIRKHPVFDTVVDVTASSHPESIDGKMEDEKKAVIKCLEREWNISVAESQLHDIGSVYYKAKDPKSIYIEHEYCTFYKSNIDEMIKPSLEFAYGFVFVDLDYLLKNPHCLNLAPWVVEGMKLL